MIVDHRTYTLRPGTVPDLMKIYDGKYREIQSSILGKPIGWFYTEFGPLNQWIHLWAYEDMADRERRRKQLVANPEWGGYIAQARPLMVSQENKLLIAAPFTKL